MQVYQNGTCTKAKEGAKKCLMKKVSGGVQVFYWKLFQYYFIRVWSKFGLIQKTRSKVTKSGRNLFSVALKNNQGKFIYIIPCLLPIQPQLPSFVIEKGFG